MNNKSYNIVLNIFKLLCSMGVGYVAGMLIIGIAHRCCNVTMTLESRQFLLFSQAMITVGTFIVGPLGYWYFVKKQGMGYFFIGEQRYIQFILLTLALILVTMLVNTYFVYWNLQLQFPTWLSEVERWVKEKEAILKHFTDLLTTFSSWKDLGVSMIVMGLIPALGEEIVFRGMLQPMLSKRCHSQGAIWITAFIFSAIHLQFYGFLPRLLLGALFGYLYSWTKNLIYPIVAHFLNNSFTLLLLFMSQHTAYKASEENPLLPIPLFIVCVMLWIAIILYIYKATRYLNHPAFAEDANTLDSRNT